MALQPRLFQRLRPQTRLHWHCSGMAFALPMLHPICTQNVKRNGSHHSLGDPKATHSRSLHPDSRKLSAMSASIPTIHAFCAFLGKSLFSRIPNTSAIHPGMRNLCIYSSLTDRISSCYGP